ncbi:4-hydroxy-tetrahydrodipicolinate synthase [Aminipila sp.]|uniref:4-hydroxy-tetrahydrodipicolinate synthase n=1 Tax=Aminipila sp. TaxID=2060095 RepID=UPI002896EA57|nr:4-hydroxy-tetrahydrodipicolinate synthase [Aminipila sp.]
MAIFTGCGVAIVTPFLPNGNVDFECFRELIEWQISEGIDAIVVCGTTGEASTLDDKEHIETIKFCVDVVNKRIPVIGGAGSNDTRHGINLAKEIEKTGVDGLLLVTPYYNKCSQAGLIEHYIATADAVNVPCILYSVPGRTGVNIAPQTVSLLAGHPNIVGIKEASGNISQVAEIARLVPDNFAIYSGNDDMVVPLMALGGIGYISVVANVAPADSVRMSRSLLNGDLETAKKLQLNMKGLIDSLFADVNPIPVKAALHMMNKCPLEYRLPLCPPSNQVMDRIKSEMLSYGLI